MPNPSPSLAWVEMLLFDVMGTLVDVDGSAREQATASLAGHLGDEGAAAVVAGLTDGLQRRMDAVVSGSQPWRSHRTMTVEAVQDALPTDLPEPLRGDATMQLAGFVENAAAFPEVPAALDRIRRSRTAVALSNADLGQIASLSRHAGLSWHAVVSAESAGSFKPAPVVYETALRMLQCPPERVLMVAAHAWDLRAAARTGVATAFVARQGADEPRPDDRFTVRVADLAELADRLEAG